MDTSDSIHISINLLERKIDLRIRKEHESYYREAEKRINERAAEFTRKWNYTDKQDLLTKLLLELTLNYIAKEKKLDEYENDLKPQMERLNELVSRLEVAMNEWEGTEQDNTSETQHVD